MSIIKKIDTILPKIAPFAFILLTFIFSVLFRIPFYDEAHAYLISQLNFFEILDMTRYEGHTALWYLLVKLTTIKESYYPYNILILNWLIAATLIIFFWRCAPFNNLVKFLITFSVPFFQYFGVVSRPYCLSVLVLFLLAFLYEKKIHIKKPIIFLLLIILCANTSIIAIFGAFGFFVLFLMDAYKYRKKIKRNTYTVSISILFIALILYLLQFLNLQFGELHFEIENKLWENIYLKFTLFPFFIAKGENIILVIYRHICFILFYFTFVLLFKKDKKILCFILSILLPFTYFLIFIHIGAFWHRYFYFIYFIILLWLAHKKILSNKLYKICFWLFLVFSLSSYSFFDKGYYERMQTKYYKNMFYEINKYKNAKIYSFDWLGGITGIMPYLKNNGIKIYDLDNYERTSYEGLKAHQKYRYIYADMKKFADNLDKTKENYIVTNKKLFMIRFLNPEFLYYLNKENNCLDVLYNTKELKMKFEAVFCNRESEFSIYKIKVN